MSNLFSKGNKKKPMGTCDVIRKTLDEFCQSTSISGISNAGKEKESNIRWTAWLIIFLIGLGATGYTLGLVIVAFISYPTTTSISYTHQNSVIVKTILRYMQWSHEFGC